MGTYVGPGGDYVQETTYKYIGMGASGPTANSETVITSTLPLPRRGPNCFCICLIPLLLSLLLLPLLLWFLMSSTSTTTTTTTTVPPPLPDVITPPPEAPTTTKKKTTTKAEVLVSFGRGAVVCSHTGSGGASWRRP